MKYGGTPVGVDLSYAWTPPSPIWGGTPGCTSFKLMSFSFLSGQGGLISSTASASCTTHRTRGGRSAASYSS